MDIKSSELGPRRPEADRSEPGGLADAVITTDAGGAVISMNEAAQVLTGWSQSEAAGRPVEAVFRIIDGRDRLSIEGPTARALREGIAVGLPEHVVLLAKDGTAHPIDDDSAPLRGAAPILDALGKAAGAVLVFSDADGRQWRRHEARDALAYAALVIATLRVPFAALGDEREVVLANEPFYETFHTSRDRAVGRPFREVGDGRWDLGRLDEWIEGLDSGRLDGRDFAVEYASEGDGRRSMTLRGRRLAPLSDRPGLAFVSIEGGDRWGGPAQDTLLRSEQRYRRLFESAKDGILILDTTTARVVDANPFMAELLGFPPAELLGKELWEIGLFSDKVASEHAVTNLQAEGYLRYDHLPLVARDGTEVEVEFVSNVYREGEARVIQCNIRDITERRELERELAARAEALATLNRRKDEFLAMLSHELRNPLASILNCIQIFQLHPEEDAAQRNARGILERQVGHLRHLVDDLLEVSRITTGNVKLHACRCDLRDVMTGAIESIRPMLDRLGHQFTASLPPDPVTIDADPGRLEQVVVNLLSNSAKYSDPGAKIDLSLRREAREVVISVSDTGIGISPELLPRVFDLFTQADRSLIRSQGGLGVGLTLVRRLVEMHGGTVEAHSAGLGRGSRFVVRLPVGAAPATDSGESGALAGRPVRVLVVDDNVDYAEGISMLLRASGYEVESAHNGPDALRAAITSRPDAVVLDIGMPGMDGYEVARRMRLEPGLEGVRLVAVSGYRADPGKAAAAAHFDDYLLKPILVSDLKSHLVTL